MRTQPLQISRWVGGPFSLQIKPVSEKSQNVRAERALGDHFIEVLFSTWGEERGREKGKDLVGSHS